MFFSENHEIWERLPSPSNSTPTLFEREWKTTYYIKKLEWRTIGPGSYGHFSENNAVFSINREFLDFFRSPSDSTPTSFDREWKTTT